MGVLSPLVITFQRGDSQALERLFWIIEDLYLREPNKIFAKGIF